MKVCRRSTARVRENGPIMRVNASPITTSTATTPQAKCWTRSCGFWAISVALVCVCGLVKADKPGLIQAVAAQEESAWKSALKIWEWSEPGYQETRSSNLLADQLEAAGFEVQRNVAKIPTAFTASFGSGEPVIGIMGEFDALPGISQAAQPAAQLAAQISSDAITGNLYLFLSSCDSSTGASGDSPSPPAAAPPIVGVPKICTTKIGGQVIGVFVTKEFAVGPVGVNVHAIVHVSDGIHRAVE